MSKTLKRIGMIVAVAGLLATGVGVAGGLGIVAAAGSAGAATATITTANPRRMARLIDEQIRTTNGTLAAVGEWGQAGHVAKYGGNIVEIEVSRDGVDSRLLRAV